MDDLIKYLYEILLKAGGVLEAGNPIVKHNYFKEKKYVMIDLRSVEETSTMI